MKCRVGQKCSQHPRRLPILHAARGRTPVGKPWRCVGIFLSDPDSSTKRVGTGERSLHAPRSRFGFNPAENHSHRQSFPPRKRRGDGTTPTFHVGAQGESQDGISATACRSWSLVLNTGNDLPQSRFTFWPAEFFNRQKVWGLNQRRDYLGESHRKKQGTGPKN